MSSKGRATSLVQETIDTLAEGFLGSHLGHLNADAALQSCQTLPLELEHMIISHLHDNVVALKAASLVCKDWTKAARRHLFHTVELAGVNRLLRFSSDVPLIPDIRESVQVLEVRGEGDQPMAAPQPLPTYVNFVVDTVASMPRLLELHFVSAPMVFKPFAINPPLRSSLRFLAFTMKNCSPEDFQCMLHIVGLFSDISVLMFSMTDSMNVDGQAMPSPEKLLQAGALPSYGPVKLRCLEILGLNHHYLPLLLCTLRHIGALRDRTLEIHLWPKLADRSDGAIESTSAARMSLEGYGAFFKGLGPALRLLDVDLLYLIAAAQEGKHYSDSHKLMLADNQHSEGSGNLTTVLGLSACTNLQWLSLYLDVPSGLDNAQVILTSTLRAYTEVLTTTHLPALNFVALHLLADGATDEDELFCGLDWSQLVSALLGLPALSRFVLYVRCNRPRVPMGAGRYLRDLTPLHRAGKFILIHAQEEDASGQHVAIPILHPDSRDRRILLGEGRQ